MYWGGPRVASFVALNMYGPEEKSMYRWRLKSKVELVDGIAAENFITLEKIYDEAIQTLGIEKVFVQISEDETAITKNICYVQSNDTLVGFCGPADDHQ